MYSILLNGILGRGGVEDTTFEAKVKDSNKIRGQEPTFRGQTFSMPSTEMIEAKGKDQKHNFFKSCSSNFP